MSVGVMKDYKLKLRNLRASHTLVYIYCDIYCSSFCTRTVQKLKKWVCTARAVLVQKLE